VALDDQLLDDTLAPSASVSIRHEPFGALLYHFGNRRLTFLKRPELVHVVAGMDGTRTVRECLGGVPEQQWPAYAGAIRALRDADMLGPAGAPAGSFMRAAYGQSVPDGGGRRGGTLIDQFEAGLDAPICLTWELTYGCNLACTHCLSASGRRDPAELSTVACESIIDEMQAMGVFYVNIGGGEPTIRPDFWHLLDYAVAHQVGVKFSTNGSQITAERAARLAATDYVDVQVSLDGATAEVNDAIRGGGSYDMAMSALSHLAEAGFVDAKLSVVVTRHNVWQLDEFARIADEHGAILRLTRLRPSGRGADVWDELHPTAQQQRELHAWLLAAGERVLTGDSFFHLSAFGQSLPGLNMCGAGRVVCLIDPVGDVYACPFAIHDRFRAGNVLADGGFARVWRGSDLFGQLREPQSAGACTSCSAFDACRGGCMAAKFFTGLPLDGPDPECVKGNSDAALAAPRAVPERTLDHSRRRRPPRACDDSPLAEAAFIPLSAVTTHA